MKNCYLLFLWILPLTFFAQESKNKATFTKIKGYVYSSDEKDPIPSTSVFVKSLSDSTTLGVVKTNDDGLFEVSMLSETAYLLDFSFIGYEKQTKKVASSFLPEVLLDTIFLIESLYSLGDVEITAKLPPVSVKGDTIEFNASAYMIDGSTKLKDLVSQISGLQLDMNGVIKYGGKPITKILLDGKEYFGNDIKMALTNLPANMINKLQLFKEESQEAKASGIKDMDPDQVLNVSVKEDYKKSVFGDVKVGMGNKERYVSRFNLNKLHNNNQFVLTGTLNNINDDEYKHLADFDNNVTKNLGLNLNIQSSEKISWNVSTNYNNYKSFDVFNSDSYTSVLRQYNNRAGNGISLQESRAMHSSLNIKPDSLTYISLISSIMYDSGKGVNAVFDSATIVDKSTTVSQTLSNQKSNGIRLNNQLVMSRKTKSGRSFTFSFGQNYDNSRNRGSNFSEKIYYELFQADTLDQRSKTTSVSQGFETSIRYVEPFTKNDKLYLSYYYAYKQSLRDGDTRRYDPVFRDYTVLDSAYSRKTESKIFRNDIRFGYQHTEENVNFNFNITASPTEMRNKTSLGETVLENLKQKVVNFSPSFRFNWKPKSTNIGVGYFGTTRYPSLSQLSADTVVISTMRKSVGNPNLKIGFTHRLSFDLYHSDFESGRSFNMNLSYSKTSNATVSSAFVDDYSNSISTYKNTSGISDGSAFINFTTPLKNRNFTLGANLNGYTSRSISFINSEQSVQKRHTFTIGTVFLVYTPILENNLNLLTTFNFSENNLAEVNFSRTKDYTISNTSRFKVKYDFIIGSIFNFSFREGYGQSVRKTEALWNLSVSKLVLKDKRGEMKFEVFDVLNNFRTQESTVSGSDYSNYWRKVVNHYFMGSFIYRFDFRNK